MNEEWLPVIGFEAYEVSSLGRVRRCKPGKGPAKIGHILKPSLGSSGYLRVVLCRPNEKVNRTVHSLVCRAFHGEMPSIKHEVAHNNGIRNDCSKGNLRWATRRENHADKFIHGTQVFGQQSVMAKITDDEADLIRNFPKKYGYMVELMTRFSISRSLIGKIRRGKIRAIPQTKAAVR